MPPKPSTGQTPRAFISYSHDSEEHRKRVLALAGRLRDEGVDAWLDRYEQAPSEGWPRWMQRQFQEADFILVICTQTYKRRFEGQEAPGQGKGATFEGLLATQLLYDAATVNRKIVSVLLDGATQDSIPLILRSYNRYHIYAEYDGLYRLLTAQPDIVAPRIGEARHLPASHEGRGDGSRVLSDGLPDPEVDPEARAALLRAVTGFSAQQNQPNTPSGNALLPARKKWFRRLLDPDFGHRRTLATFLVVVAVAVGMLASRCLAPHPREKGLLTVTWEGTAADQLNIYSDPLVLQCQPLPGRRKCSAYYPIGQEVTLKPNVELPDGRPGSDSKFIWGGACQQSAYPVLNEAMVIVSERKTECHLTVNLNQP